MKSHPNWLMGIVFCLGVVLIGFGSRAVAEPSEVAPTQPSPAAALQEQMRAAYAQLDTYQAGKLVRISFTRDGQPVSEQMRSLVLYDRGGNQLRVESDNLLLAFDSQVMRLRMKGLDSHYLEVPLPESPTSEFFAQELGPAAVLLNPDVLMLLGDKPADVDPELLPPDEDGRPGLRYRKGSTTLSLWLDPQTHLVRSSSAEIIQPNNQGLAGVMIDVTTIEIGKLIPPAMFEFPTEGSASVETFGDLIAAAQIPQTSGLKGVPAPAFELEATDGRTVAVPGSGPRVIVLDFWASWCGPCRASLPKLQELYQWAQENKKPVAIYTVNLRESKEIIEKTWTKMELSLPVLMDKDGSVADRYGVESIPYTVIIGDGKIIDVHVGYRPGLEDTIREQIESALSSKR